MTAGGLGRLGSRRAEVEVSAAWDGVCAGGLVRDGDVPALEDSIARPHLEVSQ